MDIDDPRFGQAVPCACKAKEIEEKKLRSLLEHSNLAALHDKTFDTFRPRDHLLHPYSCAREYAEHPTGWLILLGSFGTGKTHLAAAIGNRRLELGEPALFILVPDLLDHLRSSFSPASETTFDEQFEAVRNTPLLILDDLGTQTTTSWATEKLFQILNHRYILKLPTVITTNAQLDELGDRLASRMADPELSLCISLAGTDWRLGDRNSTPRSAPPAERGRTPRRGRP